MELTRLIYASTACEICDYNEVNKILGRSQELNSTNNVTGILYFSDKYFLQYLEGDIRDVNDAYNRILLDNRHTALRLIDLVTITQREFAEWAMAYIPKSELIEPLNSEFTNCRDFSPAELSAVDALKMILQLQSILSKAHYAKPQDELALN